MQLLFTLSPPLRLRIPNNFLTFSLYAVYQKKQMIGLMNAEVLAIRAAMAKASKEMSLGFPTAAIIDSTAYGIHTQNVDINIIKPVCIDFLLATTRSFVNGAFGPHSFCAFFCHLSQFV